MVLVTWGDRIWLVWHEGIVVYVWLENIYCIVYCGVIPTLFGFWEEGFYPYIFFNMFFVMFSGGGGGGG